MAVKETNKDTTDFISIPELLDGDDMQQESTKIDLHEFEQDLEFRAKSTAADKRIQNVIFK